MPFPSPGDLPDPEIEPASPAWAGGSFTTEPPGKALLFFLKIKHKFSHFPGSDLYTHMHTHTHKDVVKIKLCDDCLCQVRPSAHQCGCVCTGVCVYVTGRA